MDTAAEREALGLFDAALDIDESSRDAWLAERCGGDAALHARVRALLRADAGSNDENESAPRLHPPERIGPYRLDALIGSGGMGAVYRAQRDDGLFEQTVAIKFVRPIAGADASVAALIDAERRLLARMQHPGIARILDGGTTPDGLHYLVMEFVAGVPIDAHARTQALSADARVALLLEVCAALADAHRHLVLHNDVKPANILIDADGHAKLIDFGVARLRDVIDAALPQGFTRAYASPQRLAGAAPTVADEVYALGKLLAELLSGRLPADAADVREAEGLDAELAAVARRALDAEPSRRYASVDALADDLRRWREHRPLAALPPHWRYRARKLLQRHPWRVAAGALAGTGLVVALAVITLLYSRADAARREAEQRFAELRSLSSYMLFDLDHQLETTPGTTALRRQLVERGQHYLDALARSAGGDAALAREIGVGLGRLAEVQGGWAMPNVGEPAAARANFERAQTMLAALLERQGGDWRLRRDLGRLQQRMADFYGGVDNDSRRQLDKAREAEAHLRRAIELAGDRAEARERGELQTLLNSARLTQAFAMDWLDQGAQAVALARDEEARLLALGAPLRAAMEFEYRLGRTATSVAESLFYLDRFAEAFDAYRRAQLHYALALQAAPNHRKLLDSMAVALWGSALSLSEVGRHAEALADIERALDGGSRLLALDPSNSNAQRMLLILRSDRARLLSRTGRHDEAIALAEANIAERRERAARAPDISEPARDAVVPLHALAEMHWARGNLAAGCAAARRAVEAWAAYDKRWGLTELDRKQSDEKAAETARRCAR